SRAESFEAVRGEEWIETASPARLDEDVDILRGAGVAVMHDGDAPDELERDLGSCEQAAQPGQADADTGEAGVHRAREGPQPPEGIDRRIEHLGRLAPRNKGSAHPGAELAPCLLVSTGPRVTCTRSPNARRDTEATPRQP